MVSLRWKDKCSIYLIRTCIVDNASNAIRKIKIVQVAENIETYNSAIGVDKGNQILTTIHTLPEEG